MYDEQEIISVVFLDGPEEMDHEEFRHYMTELKESVGRGTIDVSATMLDMSEWLCTYKIETGTCINAELIYEPDEEL